MNAQEIHIDINLGLQKIASNVYRKFFPEEIDWIYNRVRGRFISSKVTPSKDGNGRFEVNQASLDDIQVLIETDFSLPSYRFNDNKVFAILPSNYQYLINDRSQIITDCSGAFQTSNVDQKIGYLRFANTVATSSFYSQCKMSFKWCYSF
jgi:hypothetical protein